MLVVKYGNILYNERDSVDSEILGTIKLSSYYSTSISVPQV